MKNLLMALTLCFSLCAQAQMNTDGGSVHGSGIGGDLNEYANCKNQELSFVIRGTAMPSFKEGLLRDNDNKVVKRFSCKEVNEPLLAGVPSAGKVLWRCKEMNSWFDDVVNPIIVETQLSQLTGSVSAYVFDGEDTIASLYCKQQ